MTNYSKIWLGLALSVAGIFLFGLLIHGNTVAILEPKGLIALKERNLLITATLLMLLIVLPVFVLTGYIAWKYRLGNKNAKYTPDWDHSLVAESVWWGIPCVIILALAILTWTSTHQLNPANALASTERPITVQVVALQWKWLFIYPDQGIATVNYVEFPTGVPVNFQITSDAPMNSFSIPQLGGQIYAMQGMTTQLHLIADNPGEYNGQSNNLSGAGFAGMHFKARSTTKEDFQKWVKSIRSSSNRLSETNYAHLAFPSQNNAPSTYSLDDPDLYNHVIMKYMQPQGSTNTMPSMQMQ